MAFLPAGSDSCEAAGRRSGGCCSHPPSRRPEGAAPREARRRGSPRPWASLGTLGRCSHHLPACARPESTGAPAGTAVHALNTVLPRLWCESKCLSLPGILRAPEGPRWCAWTSWSTQDHRGRRGQRGWPADGTICTLQLYLLSSHKTSSPSILADEHRPLLGIPSTARLPR